jgi:transposase
VVSRAGPPPEQRPVSRIYRVNLETSSLSGWLGATQQRCSRSSTPSLPTSSPATPCKLTTPGCLSWRRVPGKTKTGRLWTHVRDERPSAGARPPAALFCYSPDRKGEHPRVHLNDFCSVVHADGGACPRAAGRTRGLGSISCSLADGLLRLAAGRMCRVNSSMSTPRLAHPSPKKALDRIGQLRSRRRSTDHRPSGEDNNGSSSQRQLPRHWPLGADNTVRQLSRKSELAQAFRYMRARWTALVRCFDDGHLALDHNPAERGLRCVAIGRKITYSLAPMSARRLPLRSTP